jgi:hypothetical protein
VLSRACARSDRAICAANIDGPAIPERAHGAQAKPFPVDHRQAKDFRWGYSTSHPSKRSRRDASQKVLRRSRKASGSQAELRLLYGTNYKLFGLDGFGDLQAAERWIKRPRPNEVAIDATIGLWLTPETLAMFKSYNVVSGGGGEAPYTFYRMHKLELSIVRRIAGHWSLQIGAFASPFGQNIVAEQGVVSALWYQF